jgi:uncharacterized protein (DUF1800 family)
MSFPDLQFLTQEQVDRLTDRLKQTSFPKTKVTPTRSPLTGSFDKYQGSWDHTQASHLLRRTMTGYTQSHVDWVLENGMEATIDTLLADTPLPPLPINYFYEEDPYVPIGETWVGKPVTPELDNHRRRSLYGWTIGNLLNEDMSIRERMTLFWHNHFVTADIQRPAAIYQYITLLRTNALGNFRELTKAITVDFSMLIYLNGSQNTKNAPNENYARELLELFTVGKGANAGPGDYTTFTEDDVREIARVLTGWRARYEESTGDEPYSFFNNNLHDTGVKQLSHRFGNVQIANNGDQEYKDLINIIFQHPEASRFICRKLYRWFVYYVIDDTIEQTIIEPMAEILRENDFNVKPVIEALLASEHFYDVNSIGCIIKNPVEFLVAATKQFEIPMPPNILQQYQVWVGLFRTTELLQMVYYSPPSVAGWKAFHQEPTYNELWISAVTLVIRQLFTDGIATVGFESVNGSRFIIDVLAAAARIDNASNPNALIQGIAELAYPVLLTQDQIDGFKEVLIPGLPDFEWTVEYEAYLADPTNDVVRIPVEQKLRLLIRAMLARPEYHLA